MMKKYIATFYTHFGLLSFKSRLTELGWTDFESLPCPRQLSVSCGTAISFNPGTTAGASGPAGPENPAGHASPTWLNQLLDEDTEAVYRVEDKAGRPTYLELYKNLD